MSDATEEVKVSIIVPVYNVERYLPKCMESVLSQTLKEIEVILVDDGSTDGSGAICDDYKRDSRVQVIHKQNGGLSDARNTGVKASSAEYIGFVDSDDYIENDMYELLYGNMISYDADISFCGINDVYATGIRPAYVQTEGEFVTDGKTAIQMVLRGQNASVSAVNKLYKKSLLEKHPFPKGKTSEDAHFIIPYLTEINKAVFDMSPKYYYIHREGTITTRPYRKTDLSIVEAYDNNRKIIQKLYPELIELADFRYYWSLFYIIDKMIRTDSYGEEGDYQRIVSSIKKEYRNIMKNQYVGKARKAAVTGLMIHKKLYELCLYVYTKKRKQLVAD